MQRPFPGELWLPTGEQTEGTTLRAELCLPGSRRKRGLISRPMPPTGSPAESRQCKVSPTCSPSMAPAQKLASSLRSPSTLLLGLALKPPITAPQCSQEAAHAPPPDIQALQDQALISLTFPPPQTPTQTPSNMELLTEHLILDVDGSAKNSRY